MTSMIPSPGRDGRTVRLTTTPAHRRPVHRRNHTNARLRSAGRATGLVLLAALLGGCPMLLPPDGTPPGRTDVNLEGPRLGGDRTTQAQIENGQFTLDELRARGMRMFTTPFNRQDGYGDGPMDPNNPTAPGGRPTLQGNGVFLRVNGLDAQTCLECHAIVSNATIPATFGIGGVGGSVTNALAGPMMIDVSDQQAAGMASFNGRFINPPFLFGAGGVELLAKEMTADLQTLRQTAMDTPGQWVALVTKGVSFGEIRYDGGQFDTSRIEGIDDDLVVRPFGRKGEFETVRAFDIGAMMFHFGMQPVEIVGEGVDADGDGVANEVLTGELSALDIFATTLERPFSEPRDENAERGATLFEQVGCAQCHVPTLTTERRSLPLSYPEVPTDPFANVFYEIDLTAAAPGFDPVDGGGVAVPLYSDLKRHDMGPELAEATGSPLDAQFVTARLWGVADTAPYLHDGRAGMLSEAIMMHGGEAAAARDAFAALSAEQQADLIAFLWTLRTPLAPAAGIEPTTE